MKTKTLIFLSLILTISLFAFSAANLRFWTPMDMTPTSPAVGNSVAFHVQMKSQNEASSNVRVIGGVDGTTILDHTYASLAMGEIKDLNFSWTATAGSHTAWFHLDPDETTGDPYPENNYIEITFTVGGGVPSGGPNLTLSVSYSPSSFDTGDLVTFSLTVDNTGDEASTAATMYMKQNGSTIHTFSIPVLTPSAAPITVTQGWTVVCDAVILFEINYSDTLASDNSWSKTMSCGLITINPDILKKFKLYEWRPIPFPPDPWWHDLFQKGDPVDLLKQIGRLLGEQEKPDYNTVKAHWMKFLKNSNGLNPNTALKLITEEASKLGESKFKGQKALRGFANNLKGALNDMSDAAANFLRNKKIGELKLNRQMQ